MGLLGMGDQRLLAGGTKELPPTETLNPAPSSSGLAVGHEVVSPYEKAIRYTGADNQMIVESDPKSPRF